jgi:hypothetical protein
VFRPKTQPRPKMRFKSPSNSRHCLYSTVIHNELYLVRSLFIWISTFDQYTVTAIFSQHLLQPFLSLSLPTLSPQRRESRPLGCNSHGLDLCVCRSSILFCRYLWSNLRMTEALFESLELLWTSMCEYSLGLLGFPSPR